VFHLNSGFANWRKKSHWLILLASGYLLSGCSSLPTEPTHSVEWQAHQQQLAELSRYTLSGKMAYISPDERQSLNFYWKRSPAKSQLTLTTFLGQTALDLTITTLGAKVVTHDGRTFEHPNANMLVKKLTGLSIPVKELSDWAKGLPTNADDYQIGSLNTLESLQKNVNGQPWNVVFNRYSEQSMKDQPSLVLPSSITLNHDQTKIKLAISKWVITQ